MQQSLDSLLLSSPEIEVAVHPVVADILILDLLIVLRQGGVHPLVTNLPTGGEYLAQGDFVVAPALPGVNHRHVGHEIGPLLDAAGVDWLIVHVEVLHDEFHPVGRGAFGSDRRNTRHHQSREQHALAVRDHFEMMNTGIDAGQLNAGDRPVGDNLPHRVVIDGVLEPERAGPAASGGEPRHADECVGRALRAVPPAAERPGNFIGNRLRPLVVTQENQRLQDHRQVAQVGSVGAR